MADAPLSDRAGARPPADPVTPPAGDAPAGRRTLTLRRLFGLDRSGPPPPETLAGRPLRPWTIPNLIVFLRLAGIPVFLAIAFSSGDGTSLAAAWLYLGLALSDYADGIAARVTRQYSRLGAILDPLVDRFLVVAGLAVCFYFDTLPRWAIVILMARELFMLALARFGMKRGFELQINWFGRIGIWWTLAAPGWALADVRFLALLGLYVGLALSLASTAQYVRDGVGQLHERPSS